MSFVFRGARADIETGGIPDRRLRSLTPLHHRLHARSGHSDYMAFLFTVLVLFMILNSRQMSPNSMLWVILGVFLMATGLRMYATCRQLQIEAAANELLEHSTVRVHMPRSAFVNRGRLHSLRLQLALLDRDFDDLDYDALRALDVDIAPETPAMTDEEIDALPVHEYRAQSLVRQRSDGSQGHEESSSAVNAKRHVSSKSDRSTDILDELTCSICLEQVNVGELVRSLPCLHQFHASCINPWLRQRGTCPICKSRAALPWQRSGDGETEVSDVP